MQNRSLLTLAGLTLATTLISVPVHAQNVRTVDLANLTQARCAQTCGEWVASLPRFVAEPLPLQLQTGWTLLSTQLTHRMSGSSVPATDQQLTTASIAPAGAPTGREDVFGSVAIPFKKLSALAKAKPTFDAIAEGSALQCGELECKSETTALTNTLAKVKTASIRDKLNAVNFAVNGAIRYTTDSDQYGKQDVWSSPSETLARRKGDCEDYALLKMAALAADGVPLKDMSIVVLYDTKRHFYHAVLSVTVQDRHFILDNRREQVLMDKDLPDYQPLFSISEGRGYLHGSKIKNQALASIKGFDGVAPGEGADL
ncbi:transglutaminase-like cysteine peptidase [Rhizobium helianthi]|uniref:Transglutaminase-like cysteine peptidase n=1 Tax=Rhizobium helianthi TaxID=1132695 RepID=A0ABW4M8A2_9HYPH